MKTSTIQRSATVWIMILGGCNVLPNGFSGSGGAGDTGGTGGAGGGGSRSLLEDFEDDSGNGTGQFADSLFVHDTSGAGFVEIVDESFGGQVAPYMSSAHALFVATGPDLVSFDLNSGEAVTSAKLWVNSFYGPAFVQVIGRGDGLVFEFNQGVQEWQSIEVSSTDIGTNGTTLGEILELRLDGGEALYDDLSITLGGAAP